MSPAHRDFHQRIRCTTEQTDLQRINATAEFLGRIRYLTAHGRAGVRRCVTAYVCVVPQFPVAASPRGSERTRPLDK